MKRTLNATFHFIGGAAIVLGVLLAVRAAGLADLGGEFSEMAHSAVSGVACVGLGALLARWTV